MGLPNVSLATAIPYVAAAYIGIWGVLFVYLLVLGGRVSGLRRQIVALTDAVEAKAKKEEHVKA